MIFIADIVDPDQMGGASRVVIETNLIKGLSEKNGVAHITFDVYGCDYRKTVAVHQSFDEIYQMMKYEEKIKQ